MAGTGQADRLDRRARVDLPACVHRGSERPQRGRDAEFVKLGGTTMDEPVDYAVIIDRISHEVPYYRTYLKHAVLQGVTVDQQSVHVDGGRQVLRARRWRRSSASRARRRSCCRTRSTSPASTTTRACATWSIRSTGRGSSTTSACRASSRMPTAAAGATSTSAARSTS